MSTIQSFLLTVLLYFICTYEKMETPLSSELGRSSSNLHHLSQIATPSHRPDICNKWCESCHLPFPLHPGTPRARFGSSCLAWSPSSRSGPLPLPIICKSGSVVEGKLGSRGSFLFFRYIYACIHICVPLGFVFSTTNV